MNQSNNRINLNPVIERHTSIMQENKTKTEEPLETDISYGHFLSQTSRFLSAGVFDGLPQSFGLIFLNFSGKEELVPILGFLISSFYFFFGLAYNHSDALNIVAGPFYSKGDYKLFSTKVLQVIVINLFLLLVTFVFLYFNQQIFSFLGLNGPYLYEISGYFVIYGLMIPPVFCLCNLLRGKIYIDVWPV